MKKILNEMRPIKGLEKYLIGRNGEIVHSDSKERVDTFLNKNGELTIELNIENRSPWQLNVAKFVLSSFGDVDVENNYISATVFYRDGNKSNVHFDNLAWHFDEEGYRPIFLPGINCKIEDFLTIPGYTRYEINSLGVIRRKKDLTIVAAYVGTRGYLVATIIDDCGYRAPVKVHRLLALIFLPHPREVTNLVVNHKDTNKLNNNLSNLEWVSQRYNAKHAIDNGLGSTGSIKVSAMKIDTREIIEFDSMFECAKFFGVAQTTIKDPIANRRGIRPYNGYYLKYESDPRPWPEKDAEFNIHGSRSVLAKNIESGEILRFNSMQDMGEALGMAKSSVFNQLVFEKPRPYKGYLLRHETDHVDWEPFNEKGKQHRGFHVTVSDIYTGHKVTYDSAKLAAGDLKIPVETLYASIHRKSPCGRFSVSYLEAS